MSEIPWEAEIDTPATIAIIGGGRAGIEAALYARFLGYDVLLFEQQRPGKAWAPIASLPMDATWDKATSRLGRAALRAQGKPLDVDLDERPTYGQYVEQYLLPLARTDLVHDSVHVNAVVRSVSRSGVAPGEVISVEAAAQREFRVLVDMGQRGSSYFLVDIVLDCSGRGGKLGLAPGGGQAANEDMLDESHLANQAALHPERIVPTVAPVRTVLVGDTVGCVRCASRLAELERDQGVRWMWLVPRKSPEKMESWQHLPNEAAREAASLAARGANERWACLPILGVERLVETEQGSIQLQVRRNLDETLEVEAHQLLVGHHPCPDWSFLAPLCNESGALGLIDGQSACVTPQPHLYILGTKRDPRAHADFSRTLDHIRAAFALIGGRADLNLYATVSE